MRRKNLATRKKLLTRVQVAAALGVSRASVERLVAEGRLVPIRRHGRAHAYAAEAVESIRAELEAARTAPGAAFDLDLERSKFMRARRIRIEMENATRRGQLVERSEVEREGQAVILALKSRLLALPRQAVMRGVIPREHEPALRALIVETLRELARWRTVADLEREGTKG